MSSIYAPSRTGPRCAVLMDCSYTAAEKEKALAMNQACKSEHIVELVRVAASKLVFENLAGGPLSSILQTLPRDKFQRFCVNIINALLCIESQGYAHTNLSPKNIFLTQDHSQVKLGNLGLDRPESHSLAEGAVNYQAPEFFMEQPNSIASNVFSFGVILFEYLLGDIPEACLNKDDSSHAALISQMMKLTIATPPSSMSPSMIKKDHGFTIYKDILRRVAIQMNSNQDEISHKTSLGIDRRIAALKQPGPLPHLIIQENILHEVLLQEPFNKAALLEIMGHDKTLTPHLPDALPSSARFNQTSLEGALDIPTLLRTLPRQDRLFLEELKKESPDKETLLTRVRFNQQFLQEALENETLKKAELLKTVNPSLIDVLVNDLYSQLTNLQSQNMGPDAPPLEETPYTQALREALSYYNSVDKYVIRDVCQSVLDPTFPKTSIDPYLITSMRKLALSDPDSLFNKIIYSELDEGNPALEGKDPDRSLRNLAKWCLNPDLMRRPKLSDIHSILTRTLT